MRRTALIVLAATTASGFTAALPNDVEAFIQKRRECDHWRGEDPAQSAERRAQIEEATKKLCVGTDRELARLKHKYRSSKSVIEALSEFEVKIEP